MLNVPVAPAVISIKATARADERVNIATDATEAARPIVIPAVERAILRRAVLQSVQNAGERVTNRTDALLSKIHIPPD